MAPKKIKKSIKPLNFPDGLCIRYLDDWINDDNADPNVLITKFDFFSKPPKDIYAEFETLEDNGGGYFFCKRERKGNASSNWPKRDLLAGEGTWSTKGGKPNDITNRNDEIVGYKQGLSFYVGEQKSDYLAEEYTKHSPSWTETFDIKALYHLYKTQRGKKRTKAQQEEDDGGEEGGDNENIGIEENKDAQETLCEKESWEEGENSGMLVEGELDNSFLSSYNFPAEPELYDAYMEDSNQLFPEEPLLKE